MISLDDFIDEVVPSVSHLMCMIEPFESILAYYDETDIHGYEEVLETLLG